MEERIYEVIENLQYPAGKSSQFSSLKAILKERDLYVRSCHETWKKLHQQAIGEILTWDAFLRREKNHPIGHGTEAFGEYNRAVWRRVNDAIVWPLLGMRRHVVKRLCLYHKRAYLSESNPDSVMATLSGLNADPVSIALWNDATSCVDIGDVLYIENGMKPVPKFFELKDGTVNTKIIDLLEQDRVSEGDDRFTSFKKEFGAKGVAQLNRVMRQKVTSEQALRLLATDHGIDPVSGHEIDVTESKVSIDTYDALLGELLETALGDKRDVIECIDGCLWVFVSGDKSVRLHEAYQRLIALLRERISGFQSPATAGYPRWDRDRIVNLNWAFYQPVSKPLFLRNLDARLCASITYGDLRDRIFLYLDWEKFGQLFGALGVEFRWSSAKEARRARTLNLRLRPPIVRGRVPQVVLGGAVGSVTDPNLVEILFDGVKPATMARILAETLRELIATKSAAPG